MKYNVIWFLELGAKKYFFILIYVVKKLLEIVRNILNYIL